METNTLFESDNFDEILEEYFSDFSIYDMLDSDISYWNNISSKALNILPIDRQSQFYKSDYQKGLKQSKEKILLGLSKWENYNIAYNECTMCTSATMASLISLVFLKRKGIKKIIFETPSYFASIVQAKLLDFEVILIPTYFYDNYKFNLPLKYLSDKTAKAIWLSQPRFALGKNQSLNEIINLYHQLEKDDFIIIDEANEHLFPSTLNEINPSYYSKVIKFRSLFKPLGLNGPRISCIFHNNLYRGMFEDAMDIMQGGIDYNSIMLAEKLYSNPNQLECCLQAVHKQIMDLKLKSEVIIQNTALSLSPLENGYLGSLHVHFSNNFSIEHNRNDLLLYCKKVKMPIILGASMYYAFEPKIEHIRLNYFINENLFLNGIKNLASYFSSR